MGVIVTFYIVEVDEADSRVGVEAKDPAVGSCTNGTRLLLRKCRDVQGDEQHEYRQYFLHYGKCITIILFCKFLTAKIISTPVAGAAGVE